MGPSSVAAEERRCGDLPHHRFSSMELMEKAGKVNKLELTPEEMEMYVNLHPFRNTKPVAAASMAGGSEREVHRGSARAGG